MPELDGPGSAVVALIASNALGSAVAPVPVGFESLVYEMPVIDTPDAS